MAKRGRKAGASGEESRAKLLVIAAEEFAEKGFYETKISSIVKKANVTQPTFYLYFESKEAIFKELVESFRGKLFDLAAGSRIETGLAPEKVPERIIQGLSAIFTLFKENINETRIGFLQSSESEEIKTQLASMIELNLIAEREDGYFNVALDMGTVAESLVGIMERLTITQLFKGLKEPSQIATEIVNLFLFGMLPPSTE
ncbi:TetR/AcrR family transcriptional regulator [Aquibacillus kalidii]|uniref:TetR/AcrR family transcriptional regulator n=1 Tax=Aquibacillus kalidii TaxID=2762597 RepID=UPI0016458409|nr:TetR/AcrR family transcriptional regulator [Aquibacillus kalidii]